MKTLLEFAEKVLRLSDKPLSCQEIWEEGSRRGFTGRLDLKSKQPLDSLESSLKDSVDNHKSSFISVGTSPKKFALKPENLDGMGERGPETYSKGCPRDPSSPLIISVESRKGGVGKTTAALNLARLLMTRGYGTLLIDADITGTNVVDGLKAPCWKDLAVPVKWHETNKNPSHANMLDLFVNHFLTGKGVPCFDSNRKDGQPHLGLSLKHGGKDNCEFTQFGVIGSCLHLHSSRTQNRMMRPDILFDELHGFWFVDFLQGLSLSFWHMLQEHHAGVPVAIVIDNSPGFVGVAPAIHDWLSNLGPDAGKFLTVASLDEQDLCSCADAVNDIEINRAYREVAAKAWSSRGGSKADQILSNKELSFYVRISEACGRRHSVAPDYSGEELWFYCGKSQGSQARSPSEYQAMILNRVPRHVKVGTLTHDLNSVLKMSGHEDPMRILLGVDDQYPDEPRKHMVAYDQYIEFQFLQSLLSKKPIKGVWLKKYIEDSWRASDKGGEHEWESFLGIDASLNPEWHEMSRRHLFHAQQKIDDVLGLFEHNGLGYLSGLLYPSWFPASIATSFRSKLRDIMLDIGVRYFDYVPLEFDNGAAGHESAMSMHRLVDLIESRVQESLSLSIPSEDMWHYFTTSLCIAVGLINTSPLLRDPQRQEFTYILADLVVREVHAWRALPENTRRKTTIGMFLAEQSRLYMSSQSLEKEGKMHFKITHLGQRQLKELYSVIASAQSRIVDLEKDVGFLLRVLVRMAIDESSSKGIMLPDVRGLVSNVVDTKTKSHDAGFAELEKGLRNATSMQEFEEVLTYVTKDWRI